MFDISIILCVYNGERWINECLEMLCAQTIRNKEIIIIDDGSEDTTSQLIDCFQKNHIEEKIKIYRRRNYGRCISRLDGMRLAKGRYVGFVDVDDYFDKDMFEVMVREALKKNYDIVECKYDIVKCTNSGNRYRLKEKEAQNSLDFYYSYMKNELYGMDIINTFLSGFVHEPLWMRIYKKQIVKKVYNNIEKHFGIIPRFVEKKCDDMFFTPALFLEANSYRMIDEVKYHYRFMVSTGSKIRDERSWLELRNTNRILIEASLFVKEYYYLKYGIKQKKDTLRFIDIYIGNRVSTFFKICDGKKKEAFRDCLALMDTKQLIKVLVAFKINKNKRLYSN